MKKLTTLLFFRFCFLSNAQKISFEYDTAGNQIKRELTIITNKKTDIPSKEIVAVKEEDLQKFLPNDVILICFNNYDYLYLLSLLTD